MTAESLEQHRPIEIRPANARDISSLIEIERQSPTTAHWTPQQYQYLLADDLALPERLALIAQEVATPAILGFLVARHLAPEWELENIVVAPEARKKGIGTRLLTEWLSRALETNSEAVFLEVRESNSGARQLYERLGFQESGRRTGYYNDPTEDAILYRKTIRQPTISL